MAGKTLHARHRLFHGHVGQPRRANHIADGMDPGGGGQVRRLGDVPVGDLDVVPIDGHVHIVCKQPVKASCDADRHKHHVAVDP